MKILEKSDNILSYLLNTRYFDNFPELHYDIQGAGQWETTESDVLIYTYILSYCANDEHTNVSFIEYKSKHVLTVEIENTGNAALETLNFVRDLYVNMNCFLENNCLSNHSKLYLPSFEIMNSRVIDMERLINQIKDIRQLEKTGQIDKVTIEPLDEMAPIFSTTFAKHITE
jgi:hypothetical protein